MERLDRFLVSQSWFNLFPNAVVHHLLKYKSDHTPILVQTKKKVRRRRNRGKEFKFETAWLLDESCESIIKNAWDSSRDRDLVSRITSMANSLKSWSSDKYEDLGKKIDEAESELKKAQQLPISKESCEKCVDIEKKLEDLYCKNEAYWYVRSRVAEMRDGDRNTRYFHHKASQRKSRNTIKGLLDSQGIWHQEEEKVEKIVCDYYDQLFTSSMPSEETLQEVIKHVKMKITPAANSLLLEPYSKDEIYAALQQMHPCKAPGPDRMHAVFYQRFWHIIGDDVTSFVSNILQGTIPASCVNKTNIALIPKVKNPTRMSEFRPISLCNVLY